VADRNRSFVTKAALAADILRLPDDVTHDECGWAKIVHERAGLSRVEATVFGITSNPGSGGITEERTTSIDCPARRRGR